MSAPPADRTWKLSRLIERLNGLLARHGDVEVWIEDADTEWLLALADDLSYTKPVRFEDGKVLISSEYRASYDNRT